MVAMAEADCDGVEARGEEEEGGGVGLGGRGGIVKAVGRRKLRAVKVRRWPPRNGRAASRAAFLHRRIRKEEEFGNV